MSNEEQTDIKRCTFNTNDIRTLWTIYTLLRYNAQFVKSVALQTKVRLSLTSLEKYKKARLNNDFAKVNQVMRDYLNEAHEEDTKMLDDSSKVKEDGAFFVNECENLLGEIGESSQWSKDQAMEMHSRVKQLYSDIVEEIWILSRFEHEQDKLISGIAVALKGDGRYDLMQKINNDLETLHASLINLTSMLAGMHDQLFKPLNEEIPNNVVEMNLENNRLYDLTKEREDERKQALWLAASTMMQLDEAHSKSLSIGEKIELYAPDSTKSTLLHIYELLEEYYTLVDKVNRNHYEEKSKLENSFSCCEHAEIISENKKIVKEIQTLKTECLEGDYQKEKTYLEELPKVVTSLRKAKSNTRIVWKRIKKQETLKGKAVQLVKKISLNSYKLDKLKRLQGNFDQEISTLNESHATDNPSTNEIEEAIELARRYMTKSIEHLDKKNAELKKEIDGEKSRYYRIHQELISKKHSLE